MTSQRPHLQDHHLGAWGLHTGILGRHSRQSITLVYTWSPLKPQIECIECNLPSKTSPDSPHLSCAPTVLPGNVYCTILVHTLFTGSSPPWIAAVKHLTVSLHFHDSLPARHAELVTILPSAESEFISKQCHRQPLLTKCH